MSVACHSCGSTDNPADAKFCRACGASLEDAPEQDASQESEPQAAPGRAETLQDEPAGSEAAAGQNAAAPAKSKRGALSVWLRRALLACLALLVFAGSVAGAYLIGHAKGDDAERVAELEGEVSDLKEEVEALEEERDTLAGQQEESDDGQEQPRESEEASELVIAGIGEARTAGQGKTVKLEEMTATLDRWEATDMVSDEFGSSRADGVFVIAVVTLGNRLNRKVTVDPEKTFQLLVDGRRFDPDSHAMGWAGGEDSWMDVGYDGIQPGASVTGTVVFDIAKSSAKKLEDEGMVLVKQFSDAEFIGEKPALPVAGLKLSG